MACYTSSHRESLTMSIHLWFFFPTIIVKHMHMNVNSLRVTMFENCTKNYMFGLGHGTNFCLIHLSLKFVWHVWMSSPIESYIQCARIGTCTRQWWVLQVKQSHSYRTTSLTVVTICPSTFRQKVIAITCSLCTWQVSQWSIELVTLNFFCI